jgi:ureidoglycolate dehydrogenase (NAD+)
MMSRNPDIHNSPSSVTARPKSRPEGVDRIILPGERGDAIRAEREVSGIPIPQGTWQRIVKAAQALGVKSPM